MMGKLIARCVAAILTVAGAAQAEDWPAAGQPGSLEWALAGSWRYPAKEVARDPIRTLTRLDIVEQEGGVRLEFEGDGFLYKMVRNITGALIDVGSGKLAPADIAAIFAAKDRRKAASTVPPSGLFLMRVEY